MRTAKLPGPCGECASWLSRQRWVASTMMVVPFLVLAALTGRGGVGGALVTGLYGLYLLRAGSYGFADAWLYGYELEEGTRNIRPHFPDGEESRVRFPSGFVHAFARLGTAVLLGGVLGIGGALVASSQAETSREVDDENQLELLSREKVFYFPLSEASAKWTFQDLQGARAALAYTSMEGLPTGQGAQRVEQMSPHDAFEQALGDAEVEALVVDPATPAEQRIERAAFRRLKMSLPPWSTEHKVVLHE